MYRLKTLLVLCLFIFSYLCSSKKWEKALTQKRLLQEYRDIKSQKLGFEFPFNTSFDECGIRLHPFRKNFLEWHFSFTGINGSAFESGIYHGRILLHPEYPRRAPAITVMTPNGRWEINKPICLSATSHHQETWDSNWNLRTLVMALRGHIITYPKEIGAILTTQSQQREYAAASRYWMCSMCGMQHHQLLHHNNHHEKVYPMLSTSIIENLRKSNGHKLKKYPVKPQRKILKTLKLSEMLAIFISVAVLFLRMWIFVGKNNSDSAFSITS